MTRPKFELKAAYSLPELCETFGWSEGLVSQLVETGRLVRRDEGMFDAGAVRDATSPQFKAVGPEG
jgi:hypothetical protein